jgi:Uma2 family endonuclease
MVADSRTTEEMSGEILATGVSFEEYIEKFAGIHCELVGGVVFKMSPAGLLHNAIQNYLYMFLSAYFSLKPIGQVISQPFTQRLFNVEPKREPDLLVVLNSNPHSLTETYMDGPADICIEIVSPDSIDRDRGIKFKEYELGGVPEYWILDPIHREPLFYRLGDEKLYVPQSLDAQGNYRTPALPGLLLHIPTLWTNPLPDFYEIAEYVKAMLTSNT